MSIISQESCVKKCYLGDSNAQLSLRTLKHIQDYPMSFSFGLEVAAINPQRVFYCPDSKLVTNLKPIG